MKSKILVTIIFLFSIMMFFSCDKDKSKVTESSDDKVTLTSPQPQENIYTSEKEQDLNKDVSKDKKINIKQEEELKVSDRLVIKSGNMSIEVEKYDESEKTITDITNKHNGYIASSKSSMTSAGKKQGSITVRVPSEKFDIFLSEVSMIGKVVSQNIASSDVTEEYIDLEARQKTQKELEQRLLKLLNEKATRLSDVLEIEDKLSAVRQKIESVEGKMKYLKSQASYSTLTISLYEPNVLQTSSGGGFFYELGEAIKTGLRGLAKVIIFLILVIIVIIPFIIIALIILWYIKRRKKKKATA